MAHYFIDGDNNPVSRTQYSELLTGDDYVHIYYRSQDGHFKKRKNQENFMENCGADIIEFVPVDGKVKNATDFAISIAAGRLLADPKCDSVYLISGDTHFKFIADQLTLQTERTNIKYCSTLLEAIIHSPGKIKDIGLFYVILKDKFGKEAGEKIMKQIQLLTIKKYEDSTNVDIKERSLYEKTKTKIRNYFGLSRSGRSVQN